MRKRVFARLALARFLTGAALTIAIAGCDGASPYRAIIREQTAAWEELEGALKEVKDQATMTGARGRLKEREDAFQAIALKAQELVRQRGDPAPSERQQLEPDAQKLLAAVGRVRKEVERVVALPGGRDFMSQFPTFRGVVEDKTLER